MSERIPAEIFPPGDFIKEELEAREWTQRDLAEILGRPQRVSKRNYYTASGPSPLKPPKGSGTRSARVPSFG